MLPATDQADRPEAPTVTLEKANAEAADQPVSPRQPTTEPPGAPAAVPVAPRPGSAASKPPRRRFGWLLGHHHPIIRALQVLALAVLVFIGIVGYSVGGYLTRPGNDSVSQRVAEWGRDHHLGSLVTWLEQVQYSQNKPTKGGTVKGGLPQIKTEKPAPTKNQPDIPHTPLPEKPVLLAGTGLPGEGVWKTVVVNKGLPAVQLTYVRPDNVHTSYYAALMWLDPKLLSGRLHEGIPGGDPGGTWTTPPQLTPELAKTVAAAFPGGFRTNNSAVGNRGGYYDDGREAEPLRAGAASLVIYQDGTATVGQWGRDVAMSPNVRSVRQNLDLLVDGGTVNPSCSTDSSPDLGLHRRQRRVRPAHRDRRARRRVADLRQQPGRLGLLARPAAEVGRCRAWHGARHQLRLEHRLLLHPRRRSGAEPRVAPDPVEGRRPLLRSRRAATSSPSTCAPDEEAARDAEPAYPAQPVRG